MTGQRFRNLDGEHDKVSLPEGHVVYAIGDIHGRLDLLLDLVNMIKTDIAARGPEQATIVFLGDYIDRGEDPAGVIEYLSAFSPPDVNCVFLMGNHEKFMIDLMAVGGEVEPWFQNGAFSTLKSYGIEPEKGSGPLDGSVVGQALKAALPAEHMEFLCQLKTSWQLDGVFFAHAGVDPDRSISDQTTQDLIWIREKFLNSEKDHGPLVVHGHTPRAAPEVMRNRINLDTYAWQSDILTAVALENGSCRFLST